MSSVNAPEPVAAGFQVGVESHPMTPVDKNGNSFGTVANPLATNQVVGTPVYATATTAAGASISATLPAATGKTTYLNGFYAVCDTNATTKQVIVTVSLDGGTTTHMNFLLASSTSIPGVLDVVFPDPIPAKGQNITIVITVPGMSGTSAATLTAFGYQL